MNEKRPSYFNKVKTIGGHKFYMNDQGRLYVPENEENFEVFLWSLFKKIKNPTEEQILNYQIIKEYPFLLPKNRWDKGLSIDKDYGFDFTWTEINSMPRGWFLAFGKQMLEELKAFFMSKDPEFIYKYMIVDIKEKYGSLRWYDNGMPEGGYNIINKYERLSEKTCIVCGKRGSIDHKVYWLEPLCKKHRDYTLLTEQSETILKEYEEAYKKLAKM